MILTYIRSNQGCTAEDVVNGVEKDVSRKPVFEILKKLMADGEILDNKINRKEHRYIVNNDNLVYSNKIEMNAFKVLFYKIIELIFQRPSVMQFQKERNSVLTKEDLASFTIKNKVMYGGELLETAVVYEELKTTLTTYLEVWDSLNHLIGLKNKYNDPNEGNYSVITARRMLRFCKKLVYLTDKFLELLEKYDTHLKKYELAFIENWLTTIFILFINKFHTRGITTWIHMVKNQTMILKLYEDMNTVITEVGIMLTSKLQSSFHLGLIMQDDYHKITYSEEYLNNRMLHDFEILGLKSEIRDIFKLLEEEPIDYFDKKQLIETKEIVISLMSELEYNLREINRL